MALTFVGGGIQYLVIEQPGCFLFSTQVSKPETGQHPVMCGTVLMSGVSEDGR